MSGTMKSWSLGARPARLSPRAPRWMLLAFGAVLAAACAGCTAPVDDESDDIEDTGAVQASLGAVASNDGSSSSPQQQPGGSATQAGDLIPGQDSQDPEPQPWHPGSSRSDGSGDGDPSPDAFVRTMTILPSGGHHGH